MRSATFRHWAISALIYFGELTFFPAGGAPNFIPDDYDRIVGDMLALPGENAANGAAIPPGKL